MINLIILPFVIGFLVFLLRLIPTLLFVWKEGRLLKSLGIPSHPLRLANYRLWSIEDVLDTLRDKNGITPKFMNMGVWSGRSTVLVADGEAAREIFNRDEVFKKLPSVYDILKETVFGDYGLFTSTGHVWKLHRRLLTPLFHYSTLKKAIPNLIQCTEETLKHLEELPQDKFYGVQDLCKEHTLNATIGLIFGGELNVGKMKKDWHNLLNAVTFYYIGDTLFGKFWKYMPVPVIGGLQARMSRMAMQKQISEIVKRRREELKQNGDIDTEPTDLLSLLVQSKDENGESISDQIIVDQGVSFLFAAHDTTANALAWTLYFIAKHQNVQDKIHQEVDSVIGNRGAPETDDIKNLKYVKNTIQESLRLRPPVIVLPRYSSQEEQLEGIKFPEGTNFGLSIWALHHSEKYWENPDVFDPDRFGQGLTERHAFAYCPFSAGPRNCIGQKFALHELIITVSMILRKFDLEVDNSKEVKAAITGATIEPKNLFMKFHLRKNI